MQKFYTSISFLLLVLLSLSVAAQKDSAKVTSYTITEYGLDRNLAYQPEDTLVQYNEIYHPLYRNGGVFQDLGNIGTPSRSLVFNPFKKADFNYTFNPYQAFYKTPEETKYYKTLSPYADFSYVQGQRDLLMLKAKYAMNFSPRFNIGVNYDRVTATGFYPNQYTSGYFTNIFTSYHSLNKKYAVIANYNANRGVLDESGGIVSDSLFETLSGANKASAVRLYNCQSRFKNSSFFAKQYFYVGKKNLVIKDEDTTEVLSQAGFFSHTFRYDRDQFFFDNTKGDTSILLFPVNNLDTTAAFQDSISLKSFMNRVSYAYWTKSTAKQQSFIEFAVSHKYIEVKQLDIAKFYNNVWGEATLERIAKTNNNISVFGSGQFCFTGYNQGDLKAIGYLKYMNKRFDIGLGLSNQLYAPDFTQVLYKSEPFMWDNHFSKINVTSWRADVSTKQFRNNFHLNFQQFIIANWIYNNSNVAPTQSNQVLVVNSLTLKKTFQAGVFFFDHKLIYQNVNLDIVRIPDLTANIRYYAAGYMFKKALYIQLGVDVFYNTAYYGNAYNPSARVFYLQNTKLIGNYPVIDAFANLQISKAIIFFKYEHLNMDWSNQGFYYTPNYPLPIRTFRLGVRWRMYN